MEGGDEQGGCWERAEEWSERQWRLDLEKSKGGGEEKGRGSHGRGKEEDRGIII